MSDFLTESANANNTFNELKQAVIDGANDQSLSQADRDKYQVLLIALENKGYELFKSMAAFINEYAKQNNLESLTSLKIFQTVKGNIVMDTISDIAINKENLAKSFLAAMLTTIIAEGLVVAATTAATATAPFLLLAAGTIAVGYVVNETIGTAFKEGFDRIVGPSVTTDIIDGQKDTLSIESVTGSSQNIFRHHWDELNSKTRWKIYTINQRERYEYIKADNTLTVNQNVTDLVKLDSSFMDLMKNYISKESGEASTPIVVANGENLGKAYNYFNKDIHALTQFGNQRDIYALVALRPVVFETHDKNAYEAIKLDDYSQTYIEKRSEMLYYVIKPQSETSGKAIYYKDVETTTETYNRQSGVIYTSKVLFGSEQGDNETVLNGSNGDDFIFGMGGNDTIEGNVGNDYLEGGKGQDSLRGGAGNDTYFFKKGDGSDDIEDIPVGLGNDSKADVLLFGDGINPEDLHVYVSGNNLIVDIKNSSDIITLKNWYTKANRIEYFEFSNETRLDENGIIKLIATDEVDYVKGTEKDNTLTGGANADTLVDNGQSNDTYLAGAGDTIIDGDGNGRVRFEGVDLHKGTYDKNTGTYIGDGGSYTLSGGILKFTNTLGTLTIENYSKSANSLGIHLEDKDDDDDILPETSVNEGHNENFSSPLVLDLNGNGTTSTFIEKTQTYFDMDGDGFKERTSWSENSDGLLTLDLNNDGKVTNGSELFGNNTKLANGTNAKDGFEALSQYDLNKDNVIDAKDSIYSHLKVWMDTNSDGISTSDELKTLEELNITSINLNATETSTSEAYNQISDSSSFTQDGQTKTINDVWFYQNKSDTTYEYTTPIKDSVAALPTIEGSGRVKDLTDAMNDDTVLEAKVTALLTNASSMSFANFSSAFNLFTCKDTNSTQRGTKW